MAFANFLPWRGTLPKPYGSGARRIMLSEKQVDAVEQTAAELQRRRDNRPPADAGDSPKTASGEPSQREKDRAWAKKNLRFKGAEPYLDSANALRVLARHPTFAGRFKYNETLNKVMDKGTVMLDWRVSEVVAVIQERFLPEISADAVEKALIVHANRVIQKK